MPSAPSLSERPSHGHAHGTDVVDRLYVRRRTPVHRLPAEVKTVAMVAFVLVVVFTPPQSYLAFAGYAIVLVIVAMVAQVPLRVIGPRMLIELPFVFFAFLMPFFGTGESVEVLGVTIYGAGVLAAWNILVKGTIGVAASILLSATTPARDLILGLGRLRVPSLIVQIAAFMLRYATVVTDEMARMRLARAARGFTATGVRSWPVLAQSAGALFIRSYERGERVHLAMLSRGYDGRLPDLGGQVTTAGDWVRGLTLPCSALLVAAAVLVVGG